MNLAVLLQVAAATAAEPTAAEPPMPSLLTPEPAPKPVPPMLPAPECNRDDEDGDWYVDYRGCRTHRRQRWEPGSVFGVRLGVTNVEGSDKDGTFVAAMASFESEQFRTGPNRIFSGHSSIEASLGGGSAGVEGSLGGLLTLGVRAPFGREHGPFARIGFAGEILGNNRFYYSHLDLPVGEVGYQYSSERAIFELGGRGASVITGRYDSGTRTRRELGDGSFEWAIYAAAHSPVGRVDVSYTQIQANDRYPGGAVSNLRGKGCVYLGRSLAACADGMVIDGKAYFSLPRTPLDVTSLYGGITIGVVDL